MNRILVLLLLLVSYVSAGTLIRFADSATVQGREIRLSQIAQVSGDGKEFFDTLIVGSTSGPGMRRFIAGEQVLVHTFVPDSLRRGMRIAGAMRTSVLVAGVELPFAYLEDQVRLLLKDSLPWKNYKIEFPSSEGRTLSLYHGEYELSLERVQSRYKRGKTQLVLKVTQGEWKTTFPMMADIRVSHVVAVPKRDMKRGEKIFASDVAYQLMDISDLPYEPLDKSMLLKRTEVDGYLRKGLVIAQSRIKKQADITRGSDVRIVYKNGKIAISTQGRARQDGHIGDVILVENSKSHKVIKGKVIRPGVVVIQRGGAV